jgi:hypothetical protein
MVDRHASTEPGLERFRSGVHDEARQRVSIHRIDPSAQHTRRMNAKNGADSSDSLN